MKLINFSKAKKDLAANALVRHENRFRKETHEALREIAFVLKITERVKAAIHEEPELCASVMA